MNRAEFERDHPGEFFLSIDAVDPLVCYLRSQQLVGPAERVVSLSRAGDGNMNCVVRVVLESRSLIVKQSRPWVEKYPSIAAPRDRVIGEASFYQAVAAAPAVAARMPELLLCDKEARVIVLEDLGETRDYSTLYGVDARLSTQSITQLCSWLSALHGLDVSQNADAFLNAGMRRLNHEHIFEFPLKPDNGLQLDDITPGLVGFARQFQADTTYVETANILGEVYLGRPARNLNCLLHGDFFPGSWLDTDQGLRVIDPEFAFYGPPEFDVGVLIAHLNLSQHPLSEIESIQNAYTPHAGFSWRLANQFAGVEIMRRLIGVAQLPFNASIETKQKWLELSRAYVMA